MRRIPYEDRCDQCRLNKKSCVCAAIPKLQIKNFVSIILHVKELKLTSNTAHFIEKSLPNHSHCFVRGRMNEVFDAKTIMLEDHLPIYLFPHENAVELADFIQRHPGQRFNLIVPDGSWSQARKVYAREPFLKDVTCVKISGVGESQYYLRRAPHPGMLSTFEAIAQALKVLEGEETYLQLDNFFKHFVATVLKSRNEFEAINK
jgi:DTW domain-containing protein YfiP